MHMISSSVSDSNRFGAFVPVEVREFDFFEIFAAYISWSRMSWGLRRTGAVVP